MKRVIGMFRNKFVLKLENNNRGVLTRTRSKLERNLRIIMREKSSCGFAGKIREKFTTV
jgi:hypothetical protein